MERLIDAMPGQGLFSGLPGHIDGSNASGTTVAYTNW